MSPELSELRGFLTEEFAKRKTFKPQYSKRAFSRDLGVSITSLNGFLAGRSDLNLKNVEKVFSYLRGRSPVACSWCGKPHKKSSLLIGGPKSLFICRACVDICNEIIQTKRVMA